MSPTEYVLCRIIPTVKYDRGTHYVAHGYSYRAVDDTMEPHANIPDHISHGTGSDWGVIFYKDSIIRKLVKVIYLDSLQWWPRYH